MVGASLWLTVLVASTGAVLLTIFEPVTWALIAELAGESARQANGMLATSNQLGALTGPPSVACSWPSGASRWSGFFVWALQSSQRS